MLRVGILGCGTIAAKIADSLKGNKKAVIAGVASRERNKAKKFAAAHCPDAKVFTGYEKLAASDEIDLVYIATPNTYHYEHATIAHGPNLNGGFCTLRDGNETVESGEVR